MRRVIAIVCTAATVLLAGCDSNGTTSPTENAVSGTWNLSTINGSPLPFTLQSTPKIEVLSDQLVVSSNGTFTESRLLRFTNGPAVTTQTATAAGTYTLSGTAAAFIFNDGTTGTGTVSGSTLTVAQLGFSLVYQKQ